MTKINFRPGKLAFCAMASALGAVLFGLSSGDGDWLMLAMALPLAVAAFGLARCALGDRPALRFDEAGVTINTLYRGRSLRWDEVRDIVVERTTVRYMLIIPVAKKEFISIRTKGGALSGANYKLAASLIELPVGGVMELHAKLCAAMAAAGSAPTASAISTASDTSFDPDAAIARYLAAKQAEQAAAPMASPPAATPSGPPRPVFGRRAV